MAMHRSARQASEHAAVGLSSLNVRNWPVLNFPGHQMSHGMSGNLIKEDTLSCYSRQVVCSLRHATCAGLIAEPVATWTNIQAGLA